MAHRIITTYMRQRHEFNSPVSKPSTRQFKIEKKSHIMWQFFNEYSEKSLFTCYSSHQRRQLIIWRRQPLTLHQTFSVVRLLLLLLLFASASLDFKALYKLLLLLLLLLLFHPLQVVVFLQSLSVADFLGSSCVSRPTSELHKSVLLVRKQAITSVRGKLILSLCEVS